MIYIAIGFIIGFTFAWIIKPRSKKPITPEIKEPSESDKWVELLKDAIDNKQSACSYKTGVFNNFYVVYYTGHNEGIIYRTIKSGNVATIESGKFCDADIKAKKNYSDIKYDEIIDVSNTQFEDVIKYIRAKHLKEQSDKISPKPNPESYL